MTSDNNAGCGKIALVLGAIASLIAIFIFITGKQNLPEFLGGGQQNAGSQHVSMPTQRAMVMATVTSTPTVRPTDTPKPSPTSTLIPSPTPLPDTQPGTILEIGQTWRQSGLELTMIESDWGQGWSDEGGGLYVFLLTNLESYDRSFRLSSENFSAVDNLGRSVPMIPKNNVRIPEYCSSRTVKLFAHETIELQYKLDCGQLPAFALSPRVDAGDTSLTEIIVSVSVSNINNARWRIRIHH